MALGDAQRRHVEQPADSGPAGGGHRIRRALSVDPFELVVPAVEDGDEMDDRVDALRSLGVFAFAGHVARDGLDDGRQRPAASVHHGSHPVTGRDEPADDLGPDVARAAGHQHLHRSVSSKLR